MKIISLNAWGGRQQKELETYIQEHKPDTDVFLFQEADGNIDTLREKELPAWLTIAADKKSLDEETFYNASVFRDDALPVTSGVLVTTTGRHAFGLWTEIVEKGEKYILCSIHGIAYPGEKGDTEERLDQTKVLLDFLETKPDHKHIIMGDFNLFPDTESILAIERAGYQNLIKEHKIETTRNELSWAMYDNKQLWADYAFVGPGVEVVDFKVPQNLVSDHLPMELIIR